MSDENTAPQDAGAAQLQTPAPQQANAEQPPAEAVQTEAAAAEVQTKVVIEDVGALKKKVSVEIPREKIDGKYDAMFGELGNTAQVPGFRLGHAPRRLIEKRFGKEVGQDVRNSLVGEALNELVKTNKLHVVGDPDLKIDEIKIPDSGPLAFSFEVEVAPDFELPLYLGLNIARPTLKISDRHVDDTLEMYRRAFGALETVQQPAKSGDLVVADAQIQGEGVDYRGENLELRVAPGEVAGLPLEDLPQALAGKNVGETVSLKTRVPTGHPTEAWRDKDVQVSLTVKEVKTMVLPPADDEFAKRLGLDSLAALRQSVNSRLEVQLAQEQQEAMRRQVCKFLVDHTKFELPTSVLERQAQQLFSRHVLDLMKRGVPREQIEQNTDKLKAEAADNAAADLRMSFILDRVAEQEKIEITEADVNTRVAAIARRYNRRPERLRQELADEGMLDQLVQSIREEKAVDKLLSTANIVDIPDKGNLPEEGGKPSDSDIVVTAPTPSLGDDQAAPQAAQEPKTETT